MSARRLQAKVMLVIGSLLYAMGPVGSLFTLNGRPRYIHAGWFLISVANLTVIVLMLVVFGLALLLPFPKDRSGS